MTDTAATSPYPLLADEDSALLDGAGNRNSALPVDLCPSAFCDRPHDWQYIPPHDWNPDRHCPGRKP